MFLTRCNLNDIGPEKPKAAKAGNLQMEIFLEQEFEPYGYRAFRWKRTLRTLLSSRSATLKAFAVAAKVLLQPGWVTEVVFVGILVLNIHD